MTDKEPKDSVKVRGRATVVLRDRKTKEIIKKEEKKNLVVDVGKELITSLIHGDAPIPSHIALGDSNTTPASGQTDLAGTELARQSISNTAQNGKELTYTAQFTGTWTGTVEEAGIFNDANTGTMLARFLTGTFDKDSNNEIEIRWTLTVG